MAKIMAVNAGSSSLKFKLFEMPEEKVICSGIADRITHDDAIFSIKAPGKEKQEIICKIENHQVAVEMLLEALVDEGILSSLDEIKGIGHRIVQGGKYFDDAAVLTPEVEKIIESLIPLAPLHNAAHLVGFRAFFHALPKVGNVAVFDTAYHQTMDPVDYLYPLPTEFYEKYAVRRYGAHGTSHKYLAHEALAYLPKELQAHHKIISCHIGSGASLCAIDSQKCVTTSMGLTPLAGVMMGTRCGDIDPSIMPYLIKETGKSAEELYQIFNKKSGLLGVSELSNDTRDVEKGMEEGNKKALLAGHMFARRVADYIGQYYVRLGGADLIVFSAGIGENSPTFRQLIVDQISAAFSTYLDPLQNQKCIKGVGGVISTPESKIKIVVIPTDEELMIARDVTRLLHI